MCLIVHREAGGGNIPSHVIESNLNRNPDGFGIVWKRNGRLNVRKFGPEKRDSFRELLVSIDADRSIEYGAHFRLATHGPACKRLAHPFVYDDPEAGRVYFFHNGTLDVYVDKLKESDTEVFVRDLISRLPSRWWTDPTMRRLVEMAGGWSRFLIMSRDASVRLNEMDWEFEQGLHYSTKPLGYVTNLSSDKGKDWGRWDDDSAFAAQREEPAACSVNNYKAVDYSPRGKGWVQHGHHIQPLDENKDDEADVFGMAFCNSCYRTGEYYIIEGHVYVDIKHEVAFSEGEEPIALLPA